MSRRERVFFLSLFRSRHDFSSFFSFFFNLKSSASARVTLPEKMQNGNAAPCMQISRWPPYANEAGGAATPRGTPQNKNKTTTEQKKKRGRRTVRAGGRNSNFQSFEFLVFKSLFLMFYSFRFFWGDSPTPARPIDDPIRHAIWHRLSRPIFCCSRLFLAPDSNWTWHDSCRATIENA